MFVPLTLLSAVSLSALGATTPTAPVAPASGCPGLDALNPICQAGGVVGSVASSGVGAVFNGLPQWVASGAEWLLAQIGNVLASTTSIDLGATWFHAHYVEMCALAGVVVLPLLLISTMQAIYRQSPGQLIKAFLVQLPLAMLLGVVAIQIVIVCLSVTDSLCSTVAGGNSSDVDKLLSGVSNGLVGAVGDPTMATFVLLLVGLMVAASSFVLWLELLVRAAAVYVAVLFLPLALATLVWPSISHWCRRLVETLAALILSKFVIVATLSLAASAIASGTAGSGDAGAGFASVLAGGALLLLSTFVPFAILRLIPMVEAGAISHLEGARQRALGPLTGVPRTAASFALKSGLDAHSEAKGAAAVMASGGTPGTAGAGAVGAGGGDGEPEGGEATAENGGNVPTPSGEMSGLPLANGADPNQMDLPDYVPHEIPAAPLKSMPGRADGGTSEAGGAGGASTEGPLGRLVPTGPRNFRRHAARHRPGPGRSGADLSAAARVARSAHAGTGSP